MKKNRGKWVTDLQQNFVFEHNKTLYIWRSSPNFASKIKRI